MLAETAWLQRRSDPSGASVNKGTGISTPGRRQNVSWMTVAVSAEAAVRRRKPVIGRVPEKVGRQSRGSFARPAQAQLRRPTVIYFCPNRLRG